MIDDFAIGLTHALMALAIWRLMSRTDLDAEPVATPESSADDAKPTRPGFIRPGRRQARLNRA
jgi:hypothetical protein